QEELAQLRNEAAAIDRQIRELEGPKIGAHWTGDEALRVFRQEPGEDLVAYWSRMARMRPKIEEAARARENDEILEAYHHRMKDVYNRHLALPGLEEQLALKEQQQQEASVELWRLRADMAAHNQDRVRRDQRPDPDLDPVRLKIIEGAEKEHARAVEEAV